MCRDGLLVDVSYVYGDALGRAAGRVEVTAELEEMARDHGEFRVYVVEVCVRVLLEPSGPSYVLGDGCQWWRRRSAGGPSLG